MSFNLAKKTEQLKFSLEKKGISDRKKMAVVLDLDVSGSARGFYENGAIQSLFENIAPLALTFDDNQSLQVFTFASGDEYVTEITPDANANNYADYVKKNILDNRNVQKWGGTDYAPVIKANLQALGYYQKKKGLFGGGKEELVARNTSGYPSLILIFTDGQNYDQANTLKILKECEDKKVNAYFLFLGVGNPREFNNIVQAGDLYSNTGFCSVTDINKFVGSEQIYDYLLPQELVEWMKAQ